MNECLSLGRPAGAPGAAESDITARWLPFGYFKRSLPGCPGQNADTASLMSEKTCNVLRFPLDRSRGIQGCPHCGKRTSVWPIGRLAWAYCDVHAVRWVAADLEAAAKGKLDRQQLRKGLEFLSAFVEVSR
jgi:hypothetical protein